MAWKKGTAAFLSAVLIVAGCLLVPNAVDDVLAEQGRYGINIGAAALRGSSGGWSAADGVTVYYGNYGGSPVRYRVLPESPGTQTADEESLLLDADTILAPLSFNSDTNVGGSASGNPNEWSGSEIQAWLAGQYEAGLSGADGAMFSQLEASAIADTALGSASCDVDEVLYAACMDYASSAHLFALSALEARTLYSGDDARTKDGVNCMWWVRSANVAEPMYAGYVMPTGKISIACVNAIGAGVSPALNLRLSAVLFSSAADKSAAPEEGAVGPSGSREWKLTLRDPGKSVGISDGEAVVLEKDGTVLVPYTYADGSGQNPVNQISVMITDREYTEDGARILYYGALQNIKDGSGESASVSEAQSGTGTFVLPKGLPGGYRLYLVAECVSGGWDTDYAGEPLEICPEPAEEAESETELESETGLLTAAELETEEETEGQSEGQTEGLTGETSEGMTEGQTGEASEGMTEGQTEEVSEGMTEGQTEEMSEGMTEGQTEETSGGMTEDQTGEAESGTDEADTLTGGQSETMTSGTEAGQTELAEGQGEGQSEKTGKAAAEEIKNETEQSEVQSVKLTAGETKTETGQSGAVAAAPGSQEDM